MEHWNTGYSPSPLALFVPQPRAWNTGMMEQWKTGVSLGDWVCLASLAPPSSITSFSARAYFGTFGAIGFVLHDQSSNRLPTTAFWLCLYHRPEEGRRPEGRGTAARLATSDVRRPTERASQPCHPGLRSGAQPSGDPAAKEARRIGPK
jgi:hypothetical protein